MMLHSSDIFQCEQHICGHSPVCNTKAKKRLDDYATRAQPAENSKDLDGRVLYFMENGMRHGRLPIADGAVDKETVMEVAKSSRFRSTNTATYLSVVEENEHLKETCQELQKKNARLTETNEILNEENSVGRDLSLRLYEKLNQQAPPDLVARLANLEERRNKLTCSSGVGSCQDNVRDNEDDMQTDSDDGDYHIDDEESRDDFVDEGESSDDMDGEESSDNMDGEENNDDMGGEHNSSSEDLDNN